METPANSAKRMLLCSSSVYSAQFKGHACLFKKPITFLFHTAVCFVHAFIKDTLVRTTCHFCKNVCREICVSVSAAGEVLHFLFVILRDRKRKPYNCSAANHNLLAPSWSKVFLLEDGSPGFSSYCSCPDQDLSSDGRNRLCSCD